MCRGAHHRGAADEGGGSYAESVSTALLRQRRFEESAVGTFTTTCTFETKLDSTGAEVRGRCQHPIVSGSGTSGLAGVTGRVDFKDIIGDPITYVYRGHIKS